MKADVLGLDPSTYSPHPLHGPDRVWAETNCAADLWIECLHALGEDPVAGLAFTLSTDFDGEQWRMFTYPEDVLREIYGIEAHELNVWRPLYGHVVDQLSLGHLVAFDVDGWWLPDTAGLTYRCAHQKTTVLATMVDTGARRLGYLHNTGYYILEGDDFDAVLPEAPPPGVLPPFTMEVRLEMPRVAEPDDPTTARRLASASLARLPQDNPVHRMASRVARDLETLRRDGIDAFHRWAFGTVRQCGANAELAAAFSRRLLRDDLLEAGEAGPLLDAVAVGMKSAELALARAARGRHVDVESIFEPLAERWERALDLLDWAVREAGTAGALAETPAVPTPALA
ncbi:MAG: DUF1839 family protein [Acidimicrobiales bacterium]